MIPEILLSVLMVTVLMKMLFPGLFRPIPPTGIISGKLTYASAPVANAHVTLYTPDKLNEVAVATSDVNGNFSLPEEANGPYHVTAILMNPDGTWIQADKDITIDAPTVTVDLTLERTTILRIEPFSYSKNVKVARRAVATSFSHGIVC